MKFLNSLKKAFSSTNENFNFLKDICLTLFTGIIGLIVTLIPYITHLIYAYYGFCFSENESDNDKHPPWCNDRFPNIYNYIQTKITGELDYLSNF